MSRLFLIVVLLSQWPFVTHSQTLTVSDLLTLSAVPPKNVTGYMSKKGFLPAPETSLKDITAASFIEKKKAKRKNADNVSQRLDIFTKEDIDFFVLYLSSMKEYRDGCNWLRKAGFFSNSADTIHSVPILIHLFIYSFIHSSNYLSDRLLTHLFMNSFHFIFQLFVHLPNLRTPSHRPTIARILAHPFLSSKKVARLVG